VPLSSCPFEYFNLLTTIDTFHCSLIFNFELNVTIFEAKHRSGLFALKSQSK